jgi:regulator of protease activity HflC (stomatin/prohibitin superfamily)
MEALVSIIVVAAVALVAWSLFNAFVRSRTVFEYQRGLLYDHGRFDRVVGPGRHWLLGRGKELHVVDVRPQTVAITGQEVLSADAVAVKLSLTAEYALADPALAINGVEDYRQSFHVAAQLALREIVGSLPIEDLLERRGEVGAKLTALVQPRATELGLDLRSVDLKDLTFPGDLKRTFAQVVTARREGLAALERARGETAALRNLANAARMMESNPALLQLRLIQQLGTAGGNTIVLGLPPSTTPLPIRREGADVPELPPETE